MKTLILWIDAFRYDYLNEIDTPFLHSLAKTNGGAGKLRTVFGYSSIGASFYTGVYPEKHGQCNLYQLGFGKKLREYRFLRYTPDKLKFYVLNLYRYYIEKNDFFISHVNYDFAREFSPAQEKFYVHRNSLNVTTLFDVLRDNGLSYLVYNWPYVATDKWSELTFTLNSRDATKTDAFLKLIEKNDVDVYMTHLWDLDKYGHQSGPDSKILKEALREQDRLAKKIIAKFSLEKDNILIWSDHGMLPVTNHLDISSRLTASKPGYTFFIDSTMARFWFPDEKSKEEVINRLNEIPCGHVLSRDEKIGFRINFSDNRYGDEIFLADPGTLLIPNFFQNSPVGGMHGYDLSDERELGIFILNKPAREKGCVVDLLPTILRMLSIQFPKNIDGRDLSGV